MDPIFSAYPTVTVTQQKRHLLEYLQQLDDPRIERARRHQLGDILFISLLAVCAGASCFEHMEHFGNAHFRWLNKILELPNGIPSHDTFARVWTLLDPNEVQRCMQRWNGDLATILAELPAASLRQLCVDGKTVRGSHDRKKGLNPAHLISAWCREDSIILGQIKTAEKSNEITAIPQLLDQLAIDKMTVTIDAMGCQKEIAKKIIDKNAQYLLALKGNQGTLHDDVALFFQGALEREFKGLPCEFHQTIDKEHGRIETRQYWTTRHLDWLAGKNEWPGLTSIGMARTVRIIGDQTSDETRYYIGSEILSAIEFGQLVRGHWSIENQLHWVLDVTFGEDKSRIRRGNAVENMSILRRWALTLLKRDATIKASIATKRKIAAWNPDFLLKVIRGGADGQEMGQNL